MQTQGARQRVQGLLATTFLIAAAGFGPGAALAQEKPAQDARAGDANAQAVTLEPIDVQGAAGGTVGYLATRTSSATKTDTPLRDVPQSVTVVTKQQVKDIGAQKIEDVVRYVPGVNWHQGENNRDRIVIRGQSSTADFFVNGMRDDGQVFRDLYNAERIEFLKGPNAMIFGRGGGGGVLNRVLKDADGTPVHELTLQGGAFDNKRVSADVGGKVSDTFAARLNAAYEDTDSYRDFFHMKRSGINPAFTWTTADTKIKLSYEYFHDERTADRGIPSQSGVPYPNAAVSTFFGNPAVSYTPSTQNITTAVVEHDFDGGLKVKSQTRFADYKRFYQNVYAGSAVNAATDTLTLAAYNNSNDRQNTFNQTDWTYKLHTGPVGHTVVVGSEFGNQKSANARYSGIFGNGAMTSAAITASNPVSYLPVSFTTGLSTDARNKTNLNLAAVYGQDQIELTRWLQIIGGVRFDRFDLGYVNLNAQSTTLGQTFGRIDNLVSPRIGIVVKPVDPLSLYTSYSVSYLPASGDQFNALSAGSTGLKPEQFTNKEVGLKWDVLPALAFTMALFELDRENTPIKDNTNVAVAAGASRVDGLELSLAGYITKQWQMTAGYANLYARYLTDTSNSGGTLAAKAGAHVPFTPVHTYSL